MQLLEYNRAEQLKAVYKNLDIVLPANIVVALITMVFLWTPSSRDHLWVWLISALLVVLMR